MPPGDSQEPAPDALGAKQGRLRMAERSQPSAQEGQREPQNVRQRRQRMAEKSQASTKESQGRSRKGPGAIQGRPVTQETSWEAPK